ncbi:ABC transporter permease [Saccharibacillus sp. O23]|uniref:ABC transporter permease n=1 Tax=Saccharibacillus sp. O23 TaxID=2009338 RepID=UPI000B4DFAF8|nr:ABC transporter permease [Saccharibacillus sp. O23]OWR33010.1 ABC transporter permease [Saccharibacillus sp. O23]
MFDFFRLVHNENIKIYSRVRTWVMFGIVLLTSLLMPTLFYYIGSGLSMWSAMNALQQFWFLPTVFAIAIAGDSVAGEFSRGTIKLLLIRPWSRIKILLSKYVAVVLFLLAVYAVFILPALPLSALIFGTSSASDMSDSLLGGLASSMADEFWLSLLLRMISGLMYATIAFLFSAVFRSNSLALSLTMVMMFVGGLITLIISPAKYVIGRYVLFANLNLTQYVYAPSGEYGVMSLGFSLSVLAVYYVVFLVIAFWVFRKRDVAA